METITTTESTKPSFTIAIAFDLQNAAILGAVVFIAIAGALMLYRATL